MALGLAHADRRPPALVTRHGAGFTGPNVQAGRYDPPASAPRAVPPPRPPKWEYGDIDRADLQLRCGVAA